MSTVDPTRGFCAGSTAVAATIGRATVLRRRPCSSVCWLLLLVVGYWQFQIEMGVRRSEGGSSNLDSDLRLKRGFSNGVLLY